MDIQPPAPLPSDLPGMLIVLKKRKKTPIAITGYRKAWLVLKELQAFGRIEIVPYQGVKIKTYSRSLGRLDIDPRPDVLFLQDR